MELRRISSGLLLKTFLGFIIIPTIIFAQPPSGTENINSAGLPPLLRSITHKEIYSSVDAVVTVVDNSLKSEFIVNPQANLHHVLLAYNRARNITIDNGNELIHDSEFRRLVLFEPVTFQIIDGENIIIKTTYELDKDGIVSFDIADYDKDLPLIIMPILSDIDEFAEYNAQYNSSIIKELAIELARLK